MPTQWTNEITSGSPVRASDLNELRDAIDRNRMPYGEAGYSWTDNPLTNATPIKAVHFTEAKTAIQGLWTHKSMGTIGGWTARSGDAPSSGTPVYATDLTDLRGWLNAYELDTTGAVYSARRGLHLRNAGDMRPNDIIAAKMFDPQFVVVLSDDIIADTRPNLVAYLQEISSSVEIFVRMYPTTYPASDYTTTVDTYNDWLTGVYGTGLFSEELNPPALAQRIVDLYDYCTDPSRNIIITAFYPGNEPELVWFNDPNDWQTYLRTDHLWDDLNAYYRDVYYWVQQKKDVGHTRDIKLYPPCFSNSAFVGVASYFPNGDVTFQSLSPSGQKGADRVRNTIEYYQAVDKWSPKTETSRNPCLA